jgi:potassium/hydrogen antiporter
MADVVSIFGVIAAIVFLGFLSELIFRKTNIPDVIFLIFTGIMIATVLKWVSPATFGSGSRIFTTFALVFILFQGALSMNFKTLLKSLSNTFNLSILSFFLTVVVTTLLSLLLGFNFLLSLLIGMILAGTSSNIVIPLVKHLSIKDKHGLVLKLESAVSDVFCIIGALTVIKIIQTGSALPSMIFKTILSSFALALLVGAISGVVWILLLDKFTQLANSYMVTVAMVMGLYAFIESSFVGASGPVGALAFGLILGNSKPILHLIHRKKRNLLEEDTKVIKSVLSTSAKNFYNEISFFVKTFFFVYLGILINFSNPMVFLYGAILTLGIFFVRPLAVKFVFRKQKLDLKDRTLLEVLIPKGLAAAVLAQLAAQSNIPGASDVVNIVLSVVLLSILLTSILVFLAEKNMFKGLHGLFRKKVV